MRKSAQLRWRAEQKGWEVASQQRYALAQLHDLLHNHDEDAGAVHAALNQHTAHASAAFVHSGSGGGSAVAAPPALEVQMHPDLAHGWHTSLWTPPHRPGQHELGQQHHQVAPPHAGARDAVQMYHSAAANHAKDSASAQADGEAGAHDRPRQRFAANEQTRSAVSSQLAGLKRRAELRQQMQSSS